MAGTPPCPATWNPRVDPAPSRLTGTPPVPFRVSSNRFGVSGLNVPPAIGVTELDGAEGALVPLVLVAVTVNV